MANLDDPHAKPASEILADLKPKINLKPYRFPDSPPPPMKMLLKFVKENSFSNEVDERDFMPSGKVCFLASAGGIGKTQLLLQLALSVASGEPFLKQFIPPQEGKVVMFLGEEDQDTIDRRLFWIAKENTSLIEKIHSTQNLYISGLGGTQTRLMEYDSISKKIQVSEIFTEIQRQLEKIQPTLVIFDPASRFYPLETEKDNAVATAFIEALEALTQLSGHPTILISHHTNKESSKIGNKTQGALRGSSALVDGSRWVGLLSYENDTEGRILFTHVKSNYTPKTSFYISRGINGVLHFDEIKKKGKDLGKTNRPEV